MKHLAFVASGRVSTVFLALMVVIFFVSSSQAAFIVPSAVVTPGGPAVAVPLTAAAPGSLLASLVAPFAFSTTAGTTSGTIVSAVFRNPSGTLDFYYEVVNNGTSVTALSREPDTSFDGFATSLAFRLDGASLGGPFMASSPGIIPVTGDRDSSGTVVGFNFTPAPPGTKIPPGTTSAVLVISTDATNFRAGDAEIIDGGAATVASFEPTSIVSPPPVPEPASFALVGLGLLAVAGIRRSLKTR